MDDTDPNSDIDEDVLSDEEPFYWYGYEESQDNVYPEYVNQMDNDHPINCSLNESTSFIQSSESSVQLDILAAEQQLYARRLEEGYGLPHLKYEAWFKSHHPNVNNSILLSSSQQLSSQLLFLAREAGLGLQTSCSVSPVHIDIPVTPPAITSSKSAASSSETSTHTSLTPVRQMMHPNPTKLKLTHLTSHNH